MCGFQAGCLRSCRRVQISVWLFWVRAPVCGFQCGCLGSCSRVRISVRLFGFVPSGADFSVAVWVRSSLYGFQCGCRGSCPRVRIPVWLFGGGPCGCLGSCRRVRISVWLFWIRAPVCGFQCGCLGTCSRVRISVRLFGFVPPCADFSVAVLVRSSLCGFQCGCLVSCPRVRSEVGGQAHRLGPSECFEPRWAGGLQPRWACHWIGDARTIWARAFTASRKLAPSRLMMKKSKRKPFPHHYDLLANQRWGYHSADAKWIELWVHDSCSNQPAEWTQWYVWWRYNPRPHRRGSRWTTPPIELDDPDLRVVWWWGRYA